MRVHFWDGFDGSVFVIKYRVVLKSESKLMRAIGWVLKPFNKEFMTNYVTTIGSTIYTPSREMLSPGLLQHELQHVSDSKRWPVLYELSYLFLLPLGFTMRAFWERRAYRHSIKDCFGSRWNVEQVVEWLLPQFTSSQYLWMDLRKRSVEKWIREEWARLERGEGVAYIEAEEIK
jgi:hypothetical protein